MYHVHVMTSVTDSTIIRQMNSEAPQSEKQRLGSLCRCSVLCVCLHVCVMLCILTCTVLSEATVTHTQNIQFVSSLLLPNAYLLYVGTLP